MIGGFRLEEKFHHGGLGTLWKVSRADFAGLMVMKLPFLFPGEDPLTIVSYETEQIIMPRLERQPRAVLHRRRRLRSALIWSWS